MLFDQSTKTKKGSSVFDHSEMTEESEMLSEYHNLFRVLHGSSGKGLQLS